MNVVAIAHAGKERMKSLSLHRKQHTVILEQGGVAIRVRFDKTSRKFAVEDLTAAEAAVILRCARDCFESAS